MSIQRSIRRTAVVALCVLVPFGLLNVGNTHAEQVIRVTDRAESTLFSLSGSRIEATVETCAEKERSLEQSVLQPSDNRYHRVLHELQDRYFDCGVPIEGGTGLIPGATPRGPEVGEIRIKVDWGDLLVVSNGQGYSNGPYSSIEEVNFHAPCPASIRSVSVNKALRSIVVNSKEIEGIYFWRVPNQWTIDYSGDYLLHYYRDIDKITAPEILRFDNRVVAHLSDDGKLYILDIDEHYHWYNPADFVMILAGHPPMKADIDLIVYDPETKEYSKEKIADDVANGSAYFVDVCDSPRPAK